VCSSRRNVDGKSLKNGSAKGETHTAADMAEMHLKCMEERQRECDSNNSRANSIYRKNNQTLKQHEDKGKSVGKAGTQENW